MFPILFIISCIAFQIALLVIAHHIDRRRGSNPVEQTSRESAGPSQPRSWNLSGAGLALSAPLVLPNDPPLRADPKWIGQSEALMYSAGMASPSILDGHFRENWSESVLDDQYDLSRSEFLCLHHGLDLAGADLFHEHHSFDTGEGFIHDDLGSHHNHADISPGLEISGNSSSHDEGHYQAHDEHQIHAYDEIHINDHVGHHQSHNSVGHDDERHHSHHDQDHSFPSADIQSHDDVFSSHDHSDPFGHDHSSFDSFGSMWDS